jgi:ribosomal protein S18 acetylase RimI-like enzyme
VLPEGLQTKGHWMHVIEADGQAVGFLWFAQRDMDGRPSAYLYDIHIHENERGHGYGRAAMLEFEREAARRGLHHLSLNVFGGNAPARGLYSSLGWAERAITMTKHLQA